MNQKRIKTFLCLTFLIWLFSWGVCSALSQFLNLTINDLLIRSLFIVGGFSPTIASYVTLKKDGQIRGFGDFMRQVFDGKHSWKVYLLVAAFAAIYFSMGCLFSGYTMGAPIWMALVLVPMTLVMGGNEEVGWRMILQPELEKKFGFHFAALFVGVIWWLWHFPLFFIKGTANMEMNYFLFGIMCFTLSYALGTVRKVSDGVFPCILLHCLINGFSAIFVFEFSWMGCVATFAMVMVVSILVQVLLNQKRQKTA